MEKKKGIGGKLKYLLALLILAISLITGYDGESDGQEGGNQEIQQGTQDDQNEGSVGDFIGDEENSNSDDSNLDDGNSNVNDTNEPTVTEDGTYTSKEEVAEYLHIYSKLPSNFITKKEAQKLGWVSSKGNLHEVAPGMSIGGDYFGNNEGNLPEVDGRDYHECDINYEGGYRGSERIVYSDDGLIYYTADHYETFELLYGEE